MNVIEINNKMNGLLNKAMEIRNEEAKQLISGLEQLNGEQEGLIKDLNTMIDDFSNGVRVQVRQYKHDCEKCILIGQTPNRDFYFCPDGGSDGGGAGIVRNSNVAEDADSFRVNVILSDEFIRGDEAGDDWNVWRVLYAAHQRSEQWKNR
jgi:hypothetical protein